MAFDRGYISHHMVTDLDAMRAVVLNPYIVLTDIKMKTASQLDAAKAIAAEDNRPLVIISEETSPEVLLTLLGQRRAGQVPGGASAGIRPLAPQHDGGSGDPDRRQGSGPRSGRQSGGRSPATGSWARADRIEATNSDTMIIRGHGDPQAIAARRAQVQRLYELAPPNIDKDKLQERLAKLCGGTATILAGGVTPVEQKRTIQLIEDSLNAVRAAAEEGVLVGGGVALARVAPSLADLAKTVKGDVRKGVELVQSVLTLPLARIAFNAGAEPNDVVGKVCALHGDHGYNAATGHLRRPDARPASSTRCASPVRR